MSTFIERFDCVDKILINGVYLFGAGANGEWVFDFLCRQGIYVIGFIDSDPNKYNKLICGKPCVSYSEYESLDSDKAILITSKHSANQISEKYSDNHIMPFDAWFAIKYSDRFNDFVFEDEKSYKTLRQLLEYLKTGHRKYIWEIAETNQYFGVTPFFGCLNEVFVDLGAYTGDSAERFIESVNGAFDKVYLFEPNEENIDSIRIRKKKWEKEWALNNDQVIIENKVVGSNCCYVSFDTTNKQSNRILTESSDKVIKQEMITLDSYFKDEKISFIKIDIEGEDYEALLGGLSLIKRCKPKIAVSVYHKPDDLFRVVQLLNGMKLGYRYKLRHHSNMCCETVLYCYIEE